MTTDESVAPPEDSAPRASRDRVLGLSRRSLLVGATASGSLIVGGYLSRGWARRTVADSIEAGRPGDAGADAPAQPQMWFEVPASGPVILYSPKAEMGQGIHTALMQIAAEELDVGWDQLEVRHTDTLCVAGGAPVSRGFGSLTGTAGSSSVAGTFAPLRRSAALLREMLLIEGAVQLGVDRRDVQPRLGTVRVAASPERYRTYGAVIAGRRGELGSWAPPSVAPALKKSSAFTSIGRDAPRVDVTAKVTGAAVYGYDTRVNGMRFGAVARPPRYGARLAAASPGSAGTRPGVLAVVIDQANDFAGVVAATRTQAANALTGLELRWEGGTTLGDQELDALLAEPGGTVIRDVGDVRSAMRAGVVLEAEYRTPFAAHAHLEPLAALAHVSAASAEVWVATQQPEAVFADVQEIVGSDRHITVHPTYLGGGFGRKYTSHAAAEAARLSQAAGMPVHVGWTREEDLRMGPFRPPTLSRLRGSVDASGRIAAIEQQSNSGLLTPTLPALARQVLGFDPGGLDGQFLPYGIANYRVTSRAAELPVPTGIWRGVGLLPNVFALESFVDELAHQAGIDPLAFRIQNMGDHDNGRRLRRTLTDVGERSNWSVPLPAGSGRGIACSVSHGTAVATVAEVSVKATQIRVRNVYASVDPGLVVNPAGAALQIKGAIVMGLSSTLYERVKIANGMAVQGNFDSYPIARLRDTPTIDVHLIGSSDVPQGLGEPGVGSITAAITNAVFAATGRRLRSLPLAL
jgi:isoquinoline 1-oxidoreductase subunit beta